MTTHSMNLPTTNLPINLFNSLTPDTLVRIVVELKIAGYHYWASEVITILIRNVGGNEADDLIALAEAD